MQNHDFFFLQKITLSSLSRAFRADANSTLLKCMFTMWLRPKGEDRQENWKPFKPCLNVRSVKEFRDYVNFSREKC